MTSGSKLGATARGPVGVALVGAGYIASWHAAALKRTFGARLAGVYDVSPAAAHAFAESFGAPAFSSLEGLLASPDIDCVHVLTPPDRHADIAEKILNAGKHAFVEKPLALTADEARRLDAIAQERGTALGVNHNFLMLPSYERLKRDIGRGEYGPIDSLEAKWRFPLAPLRSGPYGLWMMRRAENILFEIGPHLFAFVADLLGPARIERVLLRYPVEIPGGTVHFQGWRIEAMAGETAVTVDISLIEGCEERGVDLRGLGARGSVDIGADCYVRRRSPGEAIVVGPLAAQARLAARAALDGVVNAGRQIASLNSLAPYGLGITRACRSFYASLRAGAPVDRRLSASLAAEAIAMLEESARLAAPQTSQRRASTRAAKAAGAAEILVIGGTGYIGRHLVKALAAAGRPVRVLTRGGASGFDTEDDRIEVVRGDLKSESDLLAAMAGVKGVFHLARATERTWNAYLENDVAVAKLIGECSVKAGVRRLVYTGTIDSYDASQPGVTITEETPFGALERRNLYARSKAACEDAVLEIARTQDLPLVIVRPGIVIGGDGPLQHWGIAMWSGPADCKLWGRGDTPMPFVSVEDCVDALIRAMECEGAIGRAFNIVGEPLLTARDYFDAVGKSYGLKVRATPTPIWRFYAVAQAKYWAKRLAGRQAEPASYADWASRAKRARFDNGAAKDVLGWRPESDRERFVQRTIAGANLFGLGRGVRL